MYYYATKTGLPMFDACRAYGLALILERLGRVVESIEDVTIQDVGAMYLVQGLALDEVKEIPTRDIFRDLVTLENPGWNQVLITNKRKDVEKKIARVDELLENCTTLLSVFAQPTPCALQTKTPSGYESLPGSLDVCAFKGFRTDKLDKYNEGIELSTPEGHWALGLLGGANFIYWTWIGGKFDDKAGLLPVPQSITLTNHRQIKSIAEAGKLSRVSMAVVAAHYAVRLADAIRGKRATRTIIADRYSDLIVQELAQTGTGITKSWKAKSGSLFPMELLMSLVDKNENTSAEVLRLWKQLFDYGNNKGKEMIAITLADLIAHPSLESAESHFRVHLRASLKDKWELRDALYPTDCLQEVMHHVR